MKESTVRMAVGQLGPVSIETDPVDVVDRLRLLLRGASEQGARLVTFPELALSPFFPRRYGDPQEFARYFFDDTPESAAAPLFEDARRLRIGFCLGYAERTKQSGQATFYNSSILVDVDGQILGKYRKIHIPGMAGNADPDGGSSDAIQRFEGRSSNYEKRYFSKGDLGFPVFDFDGIRVGMAICNDRRWPETYRVLGLNGAQVILIGYNSMARRRLVADGEAIAEPGHLAMFHNHLVMQAGAYQNAAWILAAARAGEEDGGHLIGGSCIIAPTGEIIARSYSLSDELIVADCDLKLGEFYKQSLWRFDSERIVEAYAPITAPIEK